MGQLKEFFTAHASVKTPASSIGADIFSLEKHSASAEAVLARLGFAPYIFTKELPYKVRIIPSGPKGNLAMGFNFGADSIEHESEHGARALRIRPRTASPFDTTRYITAPDPDTYDHIATLALIADLDRRFITHQNGNAAIMQAIIIGHEIEHFDNPRTLSAKPSYTISVEALCDLKPIMSLESAVSQDIYETTLKEFKYARAIAPIVQGIMAERIQFEHRDHLHGHATALMLHEPTMNIFNEDDFGQAAWDATVNACARVNAAIDHTSNLPDFIKGYNAAKSILDDPALPDDYATHTIRLFVEAAEYFSPNYTKYALEQTRKSKATTHTEDTQTAAEVSLEIS